MSFKVSSKIKASILIGAFLPIFLVNCFGNFSLTKKVYGFNKSIGGGDLGGRLIRTIVMYAMFIVPIYQIAGLVDLVILNLIEFWTGNNLVTANQFDKGGNYNKDIVLKEKTLHLKFTDFGKKLALEFENNNHQKEVFLALKDQPGKLFSITDGKLNEIKINLITAGSKSIVTISHGKNIKESKIINAEDVKLLQEKFNIAL